MEFNKYQTKLTDELLETLPTEVKDNLFDILNNIEFIRTLISPTREYAKDRPRDRRRRIIVDLAHPHILEDMDYFRPAAIHFEKYGCYTKLKPNSNPNSEYAKWLREEVRRCHDGYVRESDGEWVTGLFYFYLNYSRMTLSKIRKGTKQADRIESFPEVWEGVYWRTHYLDQARNGGMYNDFMGGNHCAELSARGKAFSENQEVETPEGRKMWKDITVGSKLFAPDGSITKVTDIPFMEDHPTYTMTFEDGRKVDTTLEHLWKVVDVKTKKETLLTTDSILKGGIMNYVIPLTYDVDYPHNKVPIDPYTFGTIIDNIDTENEAIQNLFELYKYNFLGVREAVFAGIMKKFFCDGKKNVYEVYFSDKLLKDFTIWLAHSLGYKAKVVIEILGDDEYYHIIVDLNPTGLKIVGIEYKGIEPCKCVTVDRADGMFLIDNFIPTHNSKSYTMASNLGHNFILGETETANKGILSQVVAYQKEYLIKDGVLNKFISIIDFCAVNTQFPRRRLRDSMSELTWTMGYKDLNTNTNMGSMNSVVGIAFQDDISKVRGKRASFVGIEEFGSAPNLLNLYNILIPSVQEGDYSFGLLYAQGTAGDSESDFAGAQEIMYNPHGYNMYALPNVYDRSNQGKPEFVFFFPGYINRKGCYNENGVSDVVLALIEILKDRYKVKYNSSDPQTILKRIAEIPITPAEAIIKTGINIFPVVDLTERLLQIDNNPKEFDDVYTGDLVINDNGEVEYKPTSDLVIRDFPHKDNKVKGAIELIQLPQIDKNSKRVYSNRYIAGCLKKGELVNTNSGFKKVEEITLWDKLININGEEVEIFNLQQYYNKDRVYKVKLSGILLTTTFSKEHPIYSCTPKKRYNSYGDVVGKGLPEKYYDYKFYFKPVADLKRGDYVKSPILYKEEVPTEYHNKHIWYLLGVMGAIGLQDLTTNAVYMAFNKRSKRLLDLSRKEINHSGVNYDAVSDFTQVYKDFCNYAKNVYTIDKFGRHINYKLKTIPYALRKEFIIGLIDAAGKLTKKNLIITDHSKHLLCDVQDWLFSLGIISKVHKRKSLLKKRSVEYELVLDDTAVKSILTWNISSLILKNVQLKGAKREEKDLFIKDGYLYIKVESIKKERYVGRVYNFECDTHTYICNYIPTHNCDPYDDDASNTMSLGSIFILDLWTDKIVAEYTGRPVFADDFYEICRRLCLYYNAQLLYENNKKGLFAYFSSRHSLHLLADTPEYLADRQLVKGGDYGNKKKGVNASLPINNYARNLLQKWLIKPVVINYKQEDGTEIEQTVQNLSFIKSRAFLKELINYNPVGNFDRISAMGMLMLQREAMMILYQGNMSQEKREKIEADYLGNDSFFTRNYRNTKLIGN